MNSLHQASAKHHGFTLIELMIVVAIIGILAAIAIPAYQDYTIRAQVTEGLSLATGAKTANWDYFAQHGTFPNSNSEAGMAAAITGNFVSSINTSAGLITIVFGGKSNVAIQGKRLFLFGQSTGQSLTWSCTTAPDGVPQVNTVAQEYLPTSCRN